jgi:acyl-coenzyme A synthetase/AMP-(fatty) acid ligase
VQYQKIIARIRLEGRRGKDLVIGYNIYPKEIETETDQPPSVVESAVISVRHRLAPTKPKRVIFTNEMPRNTMGKVQKKVLRDIHADLSTPEDAGRVAGRLAISQKWSRIQPLPHVTERYQLSRREAPYARMRVERLLGNN